MGNSFKRRRDLWTAVLGFIFLPGGAFAGGWLINFNGISAIYDFLRSFDKFITQPILMLFDSQWAEALYQIFGNGHLIYPVLGGLVLVAAARGWKELGRGIIVLGLSVLLVSLVIRLLGSSFDRALPYSLLQNDLPQEWRLPWASLSAFPQRHMLMVAALVTALSHFARLALPIAYAYLLAVAAALLYFGTAWPADVLLSALVGYGAARYGIFLSRNLAQDRGKCQAEAPPHPQDLAQASPLDGSQEASS